MDGVTTDRIEKVSVDSLIGPLNDIEKKFAPQWLYIAGDKRIIKQPSRVSIIGTRTPSQTGIENAQKLANFLVKNDVVIISGLAKGIDKIGHETTIKAGGKTIAVLGTPLNKCYPNENLQLQKEIIRNHLAISQFPIGHPTQKKNFPLRNRTMALLSHASIIVEAGEFSGTMHQGWEALRLGRPLYIVEDLVKNHRISWLHKLIDYGADVLPIKKIEHILEALPLKVQEMPANVTI